MTGAPAVAAPSVLVGRTAVELSRLVSSGEVSPDEVVSAHLDHAEVVQEHTGAFQLLLRSEAMAEAARLRRDPRLASLPLAGVPVAVKDNIDVAGVPTRHGSGATSTSPAREDHPLVARLRAAGAVVMAKTRLPELGIWGTTEGAFGTVRCPWAPERVAGGSSGGSAAAVAAGAVPVAHGNDGLGSIRIPAAACGVFGIKPGRGLVPSGIGANDWYGMSENGALATTVQDAAVALAAMAGRPSLDDGRSVREPSPFSPLKIAVSTRSPLVGVAVDPHIRRATVQAATLLESEGHTVIERDPPYSVVKAAIVVAHWHAAVALDAAGLDPSRLERRSRAHVRIGRLVLGAGLVAASHRQRIARDVMEAFAGVDLFVTPSLASPPPLVGRWDQRSWLANYLMNVRYAPFCALWNFVGMPAASVPFDVHPEGVSIGIQLVAPQGHEARILSLASRLETLRPWNRHAPGFPRV